MKPNFTVLALDGFCFPSDILATNATGVPFWARLHFNISTLKDDQIHEDAGFEITGKMFCDSFIWSKVDG